MTQRSPNEPGRKLLFVAPAAYRLGGLAAWLDYLLPGLRDAGWTAVLGLVEGARHHRPDAYLAEHPDPHWTTIPCSTGTREGRQRALVRCLRKIEPDLVVSVNLPDSILAVARLRRLGSPVRAIAACHGIQPDLFADMQLLSHILDGVACTNRLACRLAIDRGDIARERVHYAPCGTSLAAKPRLRATSDSEPFTIAFVGRLEESQKRILDLVGILRRIAGQEPAVRLLVAGTGPDESRLVDALRAAGVMDRTFLLGNISPADINEVVYHQSDVLLVPSVWETGPIVIWEAMAAGVPIVSSSYLGSGLERALLDDVNCLQFRVGDQGQAAAQLLRLMRDPSISERLTNAARETYRSRYSLRTSVLAWSDAFARTLSAPSRPAPAIDVEHLSRASGRLDRWLGLHLAETVRAWLPRESVDAGPGGEWPHSLSGEAYASPQFWEHAKELDRAAASDLEMPVQPC